MRARDRVVELVRIRAGDLLEHPSNWRRHPERQRAALRGLLSEVGYADALLARRDGDRLVLVDGHLRKSLDPDQIVPVLVLDVTEAEADKLLLALDPLGALARPDPEALAELLGRVKTQSEGLADLIEELARQARAGLSRLLTDPEEIPERAKTRARPGDLFVIVLHRRKDVGVGVERDPDRGVPEPLGYDLGVHALEQHQRRVRVAKVVEPDMGEPGPREARPPPRGQRVGVKRRPVAPVDHEVGLQPCGTGLGAAGIPVGSLAVKVGHQEGGQHHGAA